MPTHLIRLLAAGLLMIAMAAQPAAAAWHRGDGVSARPISPAGARTMGRQAGPAGILRKEVFGFANADALGDLGAGYRAWDFSLLSTVAYFGLHVDGHSGALAQDRAWAIWHSSAAGGLIAAAHAQGTRVVLSIVYHDDGQGMCTALDHAATTTDQAAANLRGADGVNIDYEGLNQGCPDGVSARDKLTSLARTLRARRLGYLSVDTYPAAPEDPGGFFDVGALALTADSLFVMDYGMETSNGACSTCIAPTAPLTAGARLLYLWNVTRSADAYRPWAAQVILGFPYFGVKGCVGASPGPNALVTAYGVDTYRTIATYPSDGRIRDWSGVHRDPSGGEPWATYYSTYENCAREEYWDDALSLGRKYDLVNQRGFRGAGLFALDYGGGAPELWQALRTHFVLEPSERNSP